MHYFLVHDAGRFHGELLPTLASAWRANSFAPAQPLCRKLASAAVEFTQQTSGGGSEPLVLRVARQITPFCRDLWRLLAGELLLIAAVELPELEVPLESYLQLLHQLPTGSRPDFSPIEQAILGSLDLMCGTYYRPDRAGWNDLADVQRLSGWLAGVPTETWTQADLPGEDAADELEFAREWFPQLAEMYARAAERGHVIVCERL